jgi:hypothetical protein
LDAARKAMAVPAFRDALRALDPPLSHALEHAGLDRPGVLVTLADLSGEELAALLCVLGAAEQAAERQRTERGAPQVAAPLPPRPAPVSGGGPPRGRRRMAAGGGASTVRLVSEQEELDRQGDVLVRLLAAADLPIVAVAGDPRDPGDPLRRGIIGRRATTVRQHLRVLRVARRWYCASLGKVYPMAPASMLDYLDDLELHDCAYTVPQSYLTALGVLEEAGAVPFHLGLSDTAGLEGAVWGITVPRIAEVASAPVRAMQLFLGMITTLEPLSAAESTAPYTRAFAWVRLVEHWACLRWSGTVGAALPAGAWQAMALPPDLQHEGRVAEDHDAPMDDEEYKGLCKACGLHTTWKGAFYCCKTCRDSGARSHGMWCTRCTPYGALTHECRAIDVVTPQLVFEEEEITGPEPDRDQHQRQQLRVCTMIQQLREERRKADDEAALAAGPEK